MSGVCDSSKKSEILVRFHPSTLRHFERAHMLAGDLDLSQRCFSEEHSTKQERCKQWVLNESGPFTKGLASWDGSVKYDSETGRLDSGSLCSVALDSFKSCSAGPQIYAKKNSQNLESWTSARSPPLCCAQTCARPSPTIAFETNGIEAPRSSLSAGNEPDNTTLNTNG
jgi:hypothetical protein